MAKSKSGSVINMKKIGICGHVAYGRQFADGQTIKTRILIEEIENRIGVDALKIVDTCNWRKNKLKLFWNFIRRQQ